jgi:hypothetical protein
MMPLRTVALAAVALLAAACAPKRARWDEVRPPEAWLETLPPGASVRVDGAEAGRAPLSFPVPETAREYALSLELAGFEVLEVRLPGERLAGGRLLLVLRPTGFGSQRRLEADDPAGLAQAAAALLRADRPREALAFTAASVEAGDTPLPHRLAGDAWRQLGDRNRAAQEYSLYLSMAPSAPDRAAVERAIAALRGDIPMPPPPR